MKKIISTCIALMVSAACSISAFAMEVPTNTTIQDLNGVRQYIKIYTVAPDTDPQSLIDDVFEYDGYTYTYSSMTKEEQSYSEKEHHTETVTADTEKSDLSVVLKALSPSIEYDDGEFQGTLYLDHSTISTVASGYTTKSYTVSATKEIDNLDTNDMAYVPDTTTKNGVTVQLQSVDWQVQGTSLVDDILVPAQYKAVATYAGRASYRAATGYVTTAKYIGDIVAEGIESVTYRPKNKKSYRTLPLVPEYRRLLLQMKKHQEEYRELCGNCYHESDYIYVNDLGEPIRPNYVSQHFKLVLKNNNLREITFHELRHTCASLLLKSGISMKDIQAWLGHSNYNTTANIYAHLESSSKEITGNAMQDNFTISANLAAREAVQE